ncbi:Ivy family c-type lysozyme inhibitor [Hydrogenophaga laconesensis]|uniref:Inhibitor of vertebrate lysozyme (Ivy) n=1 Tax=Hydrogenophaga laconesensis TaxID=1805971 RepID=A0ABU1V5Q5_9BURK|nr:Ivy family c-type lysozyme inhibitor [Hydrogenophaga laconesensis]MDR7092777.1 hypothetical protein [Hydrogenophaga laconesensis]
MATGWKRWAGIGMWAALAGTAGAQGLRPDVMASVGGRYAVDCARADSPRMVVEARQMRIEQGNQRLTVGNLDAAFSYFGNSPPPEFRVALLGQVQGRHELTALVNADGKGQYIQLDGDPTVVANLGALGRAQFRHCNEAANQQAVAELNAAKAAEAAARAPVKPGTARHPSELIRDPAFKPLYLKALGPLAARAPWLAEMHGPATDLTQQRIDGVDYTVAAHCMPHDCRDNSAVVLYDPRQGRVYGLMNQRDKMIAFGSPPAPVMSQLLLIWRSQWRSSGK